MGKREAQQWMFGPNRVMIMSSGLKGNLAGCSTEGDFVTELQVCVDGEKVAASYDPDDVKQLIEFDPGRALRKIKQARRLLVKRPDIFEPSSPLSEVLGDLDKAIEMLEAPGEAQP